MKCNLFLGALASTALVVAGGVSPSAAKPRADHHQRVSRVTFTPAWHESYERQYAKAHPGHMTALVGDAYSGLGFYPLPREYRAAAERYGRYRSATNAVRYAVASQAAENPYFFPAGGNDYRYGVFNPHDGVGTPFFAGYYAN